MTLTQGQILNNRYRIVKLLGQGGFGAVYKAWDLNFEVVCAIKENFETAPQAQRQFLREARLLHVLRHPNLPQVKDYFVIVGQGQYLVMDFVEGQDLEELRCTAGGKLPEAQVLGWIAQVCDALAYLHSQNPAVIHRDIKPANIKITPDNRAMLVDFGIAKTYDPLLKTTLGARAVTPGYSPIEQYGQGVTDARSDIYSLGATLYNLLTGVDPLEAPKRAAKDKLIPPGQLNPAITPAIEDALLKAMDMDADARFQDVSEFKTAITAQAPATASHTAVVTQPPTLVQEPLPAVATPTPQVTLGMPLPHIAQSFPWKGVGIGGGALAGVVLLIWLVSLVGDGISQSRITQTALAQVSQTVQANATRTALVIAAAPTQTLFPATPVPSTLTPTHLPPSPTPTLGIGSTQVSPIDGMVLSYIPAGRFLMGEDADRGYAECQLLEEPFTTYTCGRDWFINEEPIHTVTLDAFFMDIYEVTNSMYAQCVLSEACNPPQVSSSYTRDSYYGDADYNNYPVINVNWSQANDYCTWAGRHLPTEAEWEYAARGGLVRMLYPWGDSFDGHLANFCDANCEFNRLNPNYNDGYADTAPVGSYPANGYGLFDMAGNVWEWVADWYSPYSSAIVENPTGLASGDLRLLRGGSWDNPGNYLRSSIRGWDHPDSYSSFGFRCALSP